MLIQGANNPGNYAHVNDEGRVESNSVSLSLQGHRSLEGNAFNVNTSEITLTDDAETPTPLKLPRSLA